ncbi:MAG TPA: hypothetical protein VF002_04135 [Gaiellaceae bacterium]
MSDFGDRIRDARFSARPAEAVFAQRPRAVPEAAEQGSEPPAGNGQRHEARRAREGLAERPESRRTRLEELTRKIDVLNAALLQEILRQPGAAEDYPRTIAVLADELAERATSRTLACENAHSKS